MKSPSFGLQSFPSRSARFAASASVALFTLCASALPQPARTIPLSVAYPDENARIGAVTASFTFGATAPGATVTVNGRPARVAPDGAWIAYVPFSQGRFILRVRASTGTMAREVDRSVFVDDGSVPAFPSDTTIVQPGDAVQLAVTGGDGSTVTASGPGFADVALAPDPALGPGAFSRSMRAPRHAAGSSRVAYRIASANGVVSTAISNGTFEVASRGVLFVGDVVAYTPDRDSGARPYGMLAPTPVAPTAFTVPLGTQLAVTARSGTQMRVALEGAPPEWIDRRELSPDPRLAVRPSASVVASTRSEDSKQTTIVVRLAGARIPFRVDESADAGGARGAIRFFGAAAIPFALHQRAYWGFRASWSGSNLTVSFRKPPTFAASPVRALSGLTVVVDPGHAPDSGAVGPVGTIERDVNLDIARRLAAKLRASGARVVMTRTANDGVRLYDRPALAERLGADLLISVHNNAWPDGVDPAKHHGYSVYYFQPHSLSLAQAIHAAYGRDTDLPDEGMYKGDLALVRTSQLPAVLTESAFITWPWEEIKLRDAAFRDRLASTMADGMERWAERMRKLETGM